MEPVWAEDVIQATANMHTVMNCDECPEKSAQGLRRHPTEGAPTSKRPRHYTRGRQSEFHSRDDSDLELGIFLFFFLAVCHAVLDLSA